MRVLGSLDVRKYVISLREVTAFTKNVSDCSVKSKLCWHVCSPDLCLNSSLSECENIGCVFCIILCITLNLGTEKPYILYSVF